MNPIRRTQWLAGLAALAAAGACAGCGDLPWGSGPEDYVKPTVAVMKFQNRAPFPLGWDLGDGMADVLVDRLVATGRYHVIERAELASVLSEQRLQDSGMTRPENRAAPGRIKNVQYLIKGTVTDFGHVANSQGFFNGGGWNLFGGGAQAIMGLTLYVVDVESGEIICSQSLNESVRATDTAVQGTYAGVAFGGKAFYRTPLGKATTRVIDKAVRRVTEAIASQPWVPNVALVQPESGIIINGGSDRGMKPAADFDVVEPGEPILDPDTGDILGHRPGRMVARIRIVQVFPRYSVATIVSGSAADLRPGLRCLKPDNLARG